MEMENNPVLQRVDLTLWFIAVWEKNWTRENGNKNSENLCSVSRVVRSFTWRFCLRSLSIGLCVLSPWLATSPMLRETRTPTSCAHGVWRWRSICDPSTLEAAMGDPWNKWLTKLVESEGTGLKWGILPPYCQRRCPHMNLWHPHAHLYTNVHPPQHTYIHACTPQTYMWKNTIPYCVLFLADPLCVL